MENIDKSEGKIESNAIIVGDFNILLFIRHVTTKQELKVEIVDLNYPKKWN